jgi:ABC-2 type transport system permease protein
MNKWFYIFNYTIKLSFIYIFNELLGSFYRLVAVLGVLVVGLQTTDPQYLMSYVLTGSLFFSMTEPFVSWELGEKIKSGQLIKDMIYPTSFIKIYIVKAMARCLYIFTSYIPVIIFLLIAFWSYFIFDLSKIWIFIPWFFVALSIRFCFEFISAAVSFWTVEFTGPVYLIFNIMVILSGSIFPLSYLPAGFEWITNLPFAYILEHPMQTYLGKYSFEQEVGYYILGLIWSVSLFWFTNFLFRHGLKKYESVGL